MANLTGGDIKSFVIVLAALVVLAGGILSLVKNWKDLRHPKEQHDEEIAAWQRDAEVKFRNDNLRLVEIEKCNRVMMTSQLAILNHLITGNGTEKLKAAQSSINDFLINR